MIEKSDSVIVAVASGGSCSCSSCGMALMKSRLGKSMNGIGISISNSIGGMDDERVVDETDDEEKCVGATFLVGKLNG